MYLGYLEEGDNCPECHKGKLDWPKTVNCSCHINPPCSACTSKFLTCMKCGWEDESPEYRDVPVVLGSPGISMREYRPKELDKTKISWRTKMHTHFTQICEGVYPEGTTAEEIREKVNGTFGGRFEFIRDGKFKFIAYTD